MSGRCESYQQGIFTVHGANLLNRKRLLIRDSAAVFLAAFLGVIVTLVGTRIWILYAAFVRWMLKSFPPESTRSAQRPEQAVPLLDRSSHAGTPHTQLAEEISRTVKDSDSEFGAALGLFREIFKLPRKSLRAHRSEILLKFGLALSFLLLFMGVTLGGIFSANVILDSSAFCKSPWCGVWGSTKELGYHTDAMVLQINNERQNAAAAVTAKCYRGTPLENGCDNLISKRITYSRNMNASCPLNGDVCEGGSTTALRLDTGYQNAMVLGLSSQEKFLFRRVTTCAPLIMKSTYMKYTNDSTDEYKIRYYYGSVGQQSYTFETPVSALRGRPGSYIVSVANTRAGRSVFVPRPEFASNVGQLTLISILPHGITQLEPSFDPVFPATQSVTNGNFTYWMRPNLIASTLACVDENEVCITRNGRFCFSSGEEAIQWFVSNPADRPNMLYPPLILLFAALRPSNVADQLLDRFDEALQIRAVLSHSGFSFASGDWRLETEGFFQSSLATLQNEIVNIASGAFHDLPYTHNVLDVYNNSNFDWTGLCDMVLVPAPGHKSVSLWGLLAILVLSVIIVIISINPEDELVVVHYFNRKFTWLKSLIGIVLAKLYAIWLKVKRYNYAPLLKLILSYWPQSRRGGHIQLQP